MIHCVGSPAYWEHRNACQCTRLLRPFPPPGALDATAPFGTCVPAFPAGSQGMLAPIDPELAREEGSGVKRNVKLVSASAALVEGLPRATGATSLSAYDEDNGVWRYVG